MNKSEKRTLLIVGIVAIVLCIGSSLYFHYKKQTTSKTPANIQSVKSQEQMKIIIQPMGKVNTLFDTYTYQDVKKVIPNVELLQPINMPSSAYVRDRGRYRADTIIHWLNARAKSNEIFVGITKDDISTNKGNIQDWGVMGLGFCPGHACVVSDFRVRNKNNYFKVVLHEIGHTMGLDHCTVKTCFMRDAEGHDTTDEETEFCPKCKNFLKNKGWRL